MTQRRAMLENGAMTQRWGRVLVGSDGADAVSELLGDE